MAIHRRLRDRRKGQTFSRVKFRYTLDGIPMSISGATILAKIRYKNDCGPIVKTLTDSDGITVTDAVNGFFEIDEFTPVVFDPALYYFDVEITFSDGRIKTYVECSFPVLKDKNE